MFALDRVLALRSALPPCEPTHRSSLPHRLNPNCRFKSRLLHFYFPAGDQAGNLHHQRDRKRERAVRKIIKTRGHFPTDDAANKRIWLALRNITDNWGKAAHNWKEAMNQFAILYDDRFNAAG